MIPQPQGVYIQAQSGLQQLENLQGVFIKQKFEALEALIGYETPNVYKVFPADANGIQQGNNTIFKCKEKSSCLARNCLPGSCRPFKMKCSNYQGQVKETGFEQSMFMLLERPFTCTCLCLARPVLDVIIVENGQNQNIGKIISPCLMCSLGLNIQDAVGNLKYTIMGSLCQVGVCCKGLPCESCQTVRFELKDAEGKTVSNITKLTTGCLKSCVGDSSNFSVCFPLQSAATDKALIVASTLFLDYMYFEENPNENNQNY
ncbi:scramblase family protein, putative [Ichthyophthirius multifiliis]|uniref:Phospholipid scramblase n=1 Tax=Ichthyophthirius multifiliis TaxID=5932 RepID=G0QYJ7_ICHMU|nr:scramblase family protein, putative [Ichthyophthirius multifiliis]EGR29704.1 scramblase family protein, putative [Ichthyophthirius multifiliis]|eukprot:XP_004030940.1 scramblase family protein, putative [Ichthyophthirius multifiliis]